MRPSDYRSAACSASAVFLVLGVTQMWVRDTDVVLDELSRLKSRIEKLQEDAEYDQQEWYPASHMTAAVRRASLDQYRDKQTRPFRAGKN